MARPKKGKTSQKVTKPALKRAPGTGVIRTGGGPESRNPMGLDKSKRQFNQGTGVVVRNQITQGGGGVDDYVVSGVLSGTDLILNRLFAGPLNIDLSAAFDNTDAQTLTWNPVTSQLSISGGNFVTLDSLVNTDDFVVSGVVAGNNMTLTLDSGATVVIDVTSLVGGGGTDEFVAITATDSTTSYLRDAIGNATTTDTLNDGTIKVRINNPGGDENIQLIVDLTTYVGNVTIDGNLDVTQDLDVDGDTFVDDITIDGSVDINNGPVNFNSTPTLISCTGATTSPVAIAAGAQYAEVTVTYDNTGTVVGDTWTKVITITPTSGLVTTNDAVNGNSGEVTVEWTTNPDIEVTLTAGAGTLAVDEVCFYNGVVEINFGDHTILNYDQTISNYTDVTEYHVGGDYYYDDNSTLIFEGDAYFDDITVNNLTFVSGALAAFVKQSIEEDLTDNKLHLVNDEDTPTNSKAYMQKGGARVWGFPLMRDVIEVGETIEVLPNENWVLYGPLTNNGTLINSGTIYNI